MTGPDISQELSKELSQEEQELSGWMRLAQKGDAEAYQALLRQVKTMLDSFVRNTLQRKASWAASSADDIVQEILLGLHSKRHTYDPDQRFLPWLYAIARYKMIDAMRAGSKYRRNVALDEELANTLPGPSGSENTSAGIDAETLVGTLPEKQRKVLEMVKIQGLSVSEASRASGFSPSDIKVTVHRAIKALQKKLKNGTTDDRP